MKHMRAYLLLALAVLVLLTACQSNTDQHYTAQPDMGPEPLAAETAGMLRITDEAMQGAFLRDYRWSTLLDHEVYGDSEAREVIFQAWFPEDAPATELWAAKDYAYRQFYLNLFNSRNPSPYDMWSIEHVSPGELYEMNLLITQLYVGSHLYLQEECGGSGAVYHEYLQYAAADQILTSEVVQTAESELARLLPNGAQLRTVKAISRDAAAVLVTTKKQVNPERLEAILAALEVLEPHYTRIVLQLFLEEAPDQPLLQHLSLR